MAKWLSDIKDNNLGGCTAELPVEVYVQVLTKKVDLSGFDYLVMPSIDAINESIIGPSQSAAG